MSHNAPNMESPIATEYSPLLHAQSWRPTLILENVILATWTPTYPENFMKKYPPIFKKMKSEIFFAIFHYFRVIGIFHLRKSSSPRGSLLAICAPNLSKIHWSPEVLWRFGIFGPTDHGQARWRRTDFSGRRPSGWLGSFQLFYL